MFCLAGVKVKISTESCNKSKGDKTLLTSSVMFRRMLQRIFAKQDIPANHHQQHEQHLDHFSSWFHLLVERTCEA